MDEITKRVLNIGWHHPGPGGLSPSNLDALQALCKTVITENGQIADIGCWTGMSSIALGFLARQYHGQVKAIDWFQGSPNTGLEIVAKEYDVHEICKANMRYFDILDTVEIIPEDSISAANRFKDGSFDFVFIDANHQYLQVLRDIDTWWPKVRAGGILAGHDCEFIIPFDKKETVGIFTPGSANPWNDVDQISIHLGVVRAVSERFGRKIQILDGLIWWVQK